jgi:membrane fusion protein, multidrug efflux system
MAPLTLSWQGRRNLGCALLLCPALAIMLGGCEPTADANPPPVRPVRTITAERGHVGEQVVLTGQINAEKETALAFRIGGRIIERSANVGDRVEPDQVLAKLDPQDELNTLRSAQAALTAAQGQLVEASNNFDRQKQLLERGFTTKVLFDQAQLVRP